MRDKSGVILVAVLAAFALSGFSAVVFSGTGPAPDDRPTLGRSSSGSQDQPAAAGPETTREWLASNAPLLQPRRRRDPARMVSRARRRGRNDARGCLSGPRWADG